MSNYVIYCLIISTFSESEISTNASGYGSKYVCLNKYFSSNRIAHDFKIVSKLLSGIFFSHTFVTVL